MWAEPKILLFAPWLLFVRAVYQVLLPSSLLLSVVYFEIVLQCPCKTVSVLTVCSYPHQQLPKPHLLSYPGIIYLSHLWGSKVTLCAGRQAAYQDIIVDDGLDLPFHVEPYLHLHEKNQVFFSNSPLSQSCGFDLNPHFVNSEAWCYFGVFQSPEKYIYLLNLILF